MIVHGQYQRTPGNISWWYGIGSCPGHQNHKVKPLHFYNSNNSYGNIVKNWNPALACSEYNYPYDN